MIFRRRELRRGFWLHAHRSSVHHSLTNHSLTSHSLTNVGLPSTASVELRWIAVSGRRKLQRVTWIGARFIARVARAVVIAFLTTNLASASTAPCVIGLAFRECGTTHCSVCLGVQTVSSQGLRKSGLRRNEAGFRRNELLLQVTAQAIELGQILFQTPGEE